MAFSQKEYNARPQQKKNRAKRNAARREAIRTYGKSALQGKDVDHKVPLRSGGTNRKSNLRIISTSKNRGWRKGRSGYK